MGGGGAMISGGRGGFFRTIGRAAASGAGTPTGSASRTFASSPRASSSSSEKPNLSRSLSMTLDSPSTIPIYPFSSSYHMYDDDFEWVSGDESVEGDDDCVLGAVPTSDEVENAVSALKQVSRVRPELDWKEPSLHLCNPRTLQIQTGGYDRVYDAFHLLQTDPSVQRMVISLSSDRAVWDAVLKNEVVLELRRAFHSASRNASLNLDNDANNSNLASEFIRWIFNGTKARARSMMEKITKLVNQLFPSQGDENGPESADPFERLVRQSYMLCVVVFLVVVVTRTQKN